MSDPAPAAAPERDPRRGRERPTVLSGSTVVYRLGRLTCAIELNTLHRFRVEGAERVPATGACLILCNHHSFLDIPAVAASLKRHVAFVARDSLKNSRFLHWVMRNSGVVFVKRGRPDRGALDEIFAHLDAGDCVAMFPEGTRAAPGTLGAFKTGAALIARRAKVPVIPAAVLGSELALPRGAGRPKPYPITMRYGAPLPGDDPKVLDRARVEVAKLLGMESEAATPAV